MSWKDWLYIPKSDKIAILILLAIILVLLGANFYYSRTPDTKTIDFSEYIPEDYKEWQSQLHTKLEDEEKEISLKEVYHAPYSLPKMKSGKTIELNSADSNQLKTIPGIGSTFAKRIVNYRKSLGGYANLEQLNEVWGLDTHLFSTITPDLTINPQYDSLYINLDSFEQLLQHPYLNYKQATVIIDIRTRKGTIRSLNRLGLLEEFKKEDLRKLTPYANFRDK